MSRAFRKKKNDLLTELSAYAGLTRGDKKENITFILIVHPLNQASY